jgi:hypothetical protein
MKTVKDKQILMAADFMKHLGDCHCELHDRPEGFSSVPLMCKR